MARRDGQNSGPKKQPSAKGGLPSEESLAVGPPQEAEPQILPFDQVAQAVGELDVSKVTVPTLHEGAPDLATELLETVSANTIQLHPEKPTEPDQAPAESQESHDVGAAQYPQTPASKLEDGSADSALAHAGPIGGVGNPIDFAQDSSITSDTKPEEGTLIPLQSAAAPNSTLLMEASSPPGDRGGPTPNQANALGSPFGLVQTIVEANLSVCSYLRKEGEAALAHLQALSSVKSPTDLVGLQAREASRSLQSALNLGQELAKSGKRIVEGVGSASKDKP